MTSLQARQKVDALIAELSPSIIGKQLGARSCSCGTYSHGTAVASKINAPLGRGHAKGTETKWFFWTVQMIPVNPGLSRGETRYSVSLVQFIPVDEINRIFEKYFEGGLGDNG